jgi:flagellar basal-body rod modification protein FlgD
MSAINALSGSNISSSTGRFSDMSSEDFMKIIFTELQSQDPFKPNDSNALLDQLNSIRSIESDVQMEERLKSVVFQNQMSTAGGLIGKRVAGLTENAERVGGVVKSVARSGDQITLNLENGWIIPMDNLEYIDSQSMPTTGGNSGGSGSNSGSGSNGSGGNNP